MAIKITYLKVRVPNFYVELCYSGTVAALPQFTKLCSLLIWRQIDKLTLTRSQYYSIFLFSDIFFIFKMTIDEY